ARAGGGTRGVEDRAPRSLAHGHGAHRRRAGLPRVCRAVRPRRARHHRRTGGRSDGSSDARGPRRTHRGAGALRGFRALPADPGRRARGPRARRRRPAEGAMSQARGPPAPDGPEAAAYAVLAHQPELLEAFRRLYGTLWSHGVLDPATKEVARIRNARTIGCRYRRNVRFAPARQQGLGEDAIDLVADGWEGSALRERHKLAIRWTDAFLGDPA